MQKILGLDIGVASIGWSFIETDKNGNGRIIRSGVRVIPTSREETNVFNDFEKGKPASFSSERTTKRGVRRNIFRRKLRKQRLIKLLTEHGMYDPKLTQLESPTAIWELRSEATNEKIRLSELGRVLLHLNNRRGFKSNRKANTEESNSQWMERVNDNSNSVSKNGVTIGKLHLQNLKTDPLYTTKNKIFKRTDYHKEFDQIWNTQAEFYPDILTDELKLLIGDYTIFYQRPLKSAKHLLSNCRYERGHKVCPRSSPLFQYFRSFQKVLDFRATDLMGYSSALSLDERRLILGMLNKPNDLDKSGNLTKATLVKLVQIGKDYDLNFEKIEGCRTKKSIHKALVENGVDPEPWLEFDPLYSGSDYDRQPLYKLWHVLYSIDDPEDLRKTLCTNFGFDLETARSLMAINLEGDYGALSTRAMKKILKKFEEFPSDATEGVNQAGYKHSDGETVQERETRNLIDQIPHIKKNELRNPVVEKVLNQLITLVNAVVAHPELGRPDEIRVELARELKNNAKNRKKMQDGINRATAENEVIRERLRTDFGIPKPSRRDIIRYRCWTEQGYQCLYSGEPIEMNRLFVGEEYELDHIIPRSRMYDDSRGNLVIVKSSENKDKDNQTAHDYMMNKGKEAFEQYLSRVTSLYLTGFKKKGIDKGINRKKRDFLLMKQSDIPTDFIDRQLRESQYIVKEAVTHLNKVCRKVTTTTGSITDLLRHQWGIDELFRSIQIAKYREWGMTFIEDVDEKTKGKEKIKDWSKRLDHRHHAMDAIIVACTTQSMIQRLNNLNKVFEDYDKMKQSVRRFDIPWEGFRNDVRASLESILISFRNRRRVATTNRNTYKVKGGKKTQTTLTPRGPFHKETIYGRRLLNRGTKVKLNKRFSIQHAEMIVDPNLRELIKSHIAGFNGNADKAFANLKKAPIVYKEVELSEVLVYDEVFTMRKALTPDFKDLENIVDPNVKSAVKKHLEKFDNKPKEAFKDLVQTPVWYNEEEQLPIKGVNVRAKAEGLLPIHTNSEGTSIDFVFTRNNHHMAVYRDSEGKVYDQVVSFWQAFERKEQGEPIVSLTSSRFMGSNPDVASYQDELVEFFMINDLVLIDCDLGDLQVDSIDGKKYISDHLFRVQKLASGDIVFRHHLETNIDNDRAMVRITSMSSLVERVRKVHMSILGDLDG